MRFVGKTAKMESLRLQFMFAIGVMPVLAACPGTDCGEPNTYTINGTLTLDDMGDSCPDLVSTGDLDEVYDSGWHSNCAEPELVSKQAEVCTYTVTCEEFYCCGYGRPYLDNQGDTVLSELGDDPSWSEDVTLDLRDLSPKDRAALAEFWLHNALAEHSSVAGFTRFALDLLAHGAPPDLVRRAQQAAAEEIQHAVDCFSLANAYSGRVDGPAPMRLGRSAPIARNLAELAAWTVRDGAVGESVAAWIATAARARTTEPTVQKKLDTIIQDETSHAQLAWETLQWALSAGDESVRQAIVSALNDIPRPAIGHAYSSPSTVVHGMLTPIEQAAVARECIEQVIAPVADALLRTSAAA